MNQDIQPPRPPTEKRPPSPKEKLFRSSSQQTPASRPSFEHVMENLDKWANSPGLQPPK